MSSKLRQVVLILSVPVLLVLVASCAVIQIFTIDAIRYEVSQSGDFIGARVTFRATFNASTATSYQWDFGDGNQGQGEVVVHTYQSEGTYQVTLEIEHSEGKSSILTQTIEIILKTSASGAILDTFVNSLGPISLSLPCPDTPGGIIFFEISSEIPNLLAAFASTENAAGSGTQTIAIDNGRLTISTTSNCANTSSSAAGIYTMSSFGSFDVDLSSFSVIRIPVLSVTGGPITGCRIRISRFFGTLGLLSDPFDLTPGVINVDITGGVNMSTMDSISLIDCNFQSASSVVMEAWRIE